eukprot:TRINITY_DN109959_c0_g1_i1.p1 TRINITY_DN109959_c0_g1~~TRINITY_DN109959_c0_g1_i1.p1  ORF type:complete len:294 (-),score=45.77 TRINITY_DN109959_c0_g1_i1:14-895(-)
MEDEGPDSNFVKKRKTAISGRPFGKSPESPIVCPLGIGTVWCGRKWPPQNDSYSYPDNAEVDAFLTQALSRLRRDDERVVIDTAYGYGNADARIGAWLKSAAGQVFLDKVLIHTKFGHSRDGPPPAEQLTLETLRRDWSQSCANLPRVDGIYYHLPSSIPEELALETLRDKDILQELIRLRSSKESGLTAIGASISNANVLKTAHSEGLLSEFDMLQVPQWMVREEPTLISELHEQGKAIAVNSPVRFFAKHDEPPKKSFEDCYTELWKIPYVSVVLTGTRYHLPETISYSGR